MKRIIILLIALLVLTKCSKKPVLPAGITINGVVYDTVKIGNQTWTSVNYNGPGGINYDSTALNNQQLGKLYTYSEAEAIILPSGWRLPTSDDVNILLSTTGVNTNRADAVNLMAVSAWDNQPATNSTGFNAMPGGFFNSGTNNYGFSGIGLDSEILTSSVDPYGEHESLSISYFVNNPTAILSAPLPLLTDRSSVRFVKDD